MSPWPRSGPADLPRASSGDKVAALRALRCGQELRAGFVSSPGCSNARGTLSLNSWHLLVPIVTRPHPTDANQHPWHSKKDTPATSPICYPKSYPELPPRITAGVGGEPDSDSAACGMRLEAKGTEAKEGTWARSTGSG